MEPSLSGQWNVLISPWLEVSGLDGRISAISPLEALRSASSIHSLCAANPLDFFAAHRFLATLLYWKSSDLGGIARLRGELLENRVPAELVGLLGAESEKFELFDEERPFLQDPSLANTKDKDGSPPSYLFAEMSSGTNVAHFHHGNDASSALCLRCATQGLTRLVPWTQSGGSGLKPSIHGAPPVMAIAQGATLCVTLGLNLVPLENPLGNPQWSGQFRPEYAESLIPIMEALTWNPRRVHLLHASKGRECSRCGAGDCPTVGPIAFKKNDGFDGSTVAESYENSWMDPAVFYAKNAKGESVSIKSGREFEAAEETDLRELFAQKRGKKEDPAPVCQVVAANTEHAGWLLVVPCTNPANNKSFDHRLVRVSGKLAAPLAPNAWDGAGNIPWRAGDMRTKAQPGRFPPTRGARAFVAAVKKLSEADLSIVAGCALKPMSHDAGAFDIFSSLYWAIRRREALAPSREAAWMTLKLMAAAGCRRLSANGDFQPWISLDVIQPRQKTRNGTVLAYPRTIPTGTLLERELGAIIARFPSKPVDWAGLCQFLHRHLS